MVFAITLSVLVNEQVSGRPDRRHVVEHTGQWGGEGRLVGFCVFCPRFYVSPRNET